MTRSMMRPFLAALATVVAVVGCTDADSVGGSTTTTNGGENQAIEDGTWFAFVTVGEDETGAMVLGVDLADMLTGDEAREAAVADGVISEGEDLPNDFYVDNDETVLELIYPDADARFTMISGEDVAEKIQVDGAIFAEIYEGSYEDEPIYGVAAGTPVAMNVTISGGMLAEAEAVYMP